MRCRWAFDGPDKYRETLLESAGPAGFTPLVAWDHIRSKTATARRPHAAEGAAKPSERLKAFELLLGRTWEANGTWAEGVTFHIQTTFEWVPLLDAIYVRVIETSKEGEATHLLDAYVYHHVGINRLRCLALSNRGGVYEGELTVHDGGTVQIDLKGHEDDRVVAHVMRVDFETDGTPRQRLWSLKGGESSLMLNVHHKKLGPKKD